MRIHRGGPAAAGIALCLGALTACGGSSGAAAGRPGGAADRGAAPGGGGSPAREGGEAPSLDGKVIVIDPGHNGGNASHPAEIRKKVKIGNGSKECDTAAPPPRAATPSTPSPGTSPTGSPRSCARAA